MDNILFVVGSPKSGTTFLQMILDRHPRVSCPPEFKFLIIYEELRKLAEKFNNYSNFIDKYTASQGAILLNDIDLEKIFAFIIGLIAQKGAKKKKVKWYGLKDPSLLFFLSFLEKHFPQARFICPIRDPRSVAVSSWYHNLRTDPHFLRTRGRSKEHWAAEIAGIWKRDTEWLLDLQKRLPGRVLLVRYEDLRQDPHPHYQKIFAFLEVEDDPKIVARIVEDTRFERFRDGKFFRRASLTDWEKELPPRAIEILEKTTLPLLKKFSYTPKFVS